MTGNGSASQTATIGTPRAGRPSQTLVLVGHGSHLDPGAARPVYDHADAIRAKGTFDAVRTAFWKGTPSLRDVGRMVASDRVTIVPVTMSGGYFADEVFPRELGIADDHSESDARVRYAEPVGTHPALTDVIVDRALGARGAPDDGQGLGLAIVGHGTERNPNSGAAAEAHADRIRQEDRFDEVRACFLDQPPVVTDLTAMFETDRIVAVPLFVAPGGHVTADIPAAIGLSTGHPTVSMEPERVDKRTIWYAPPVGTAPGVVDVILERAAAAGADIDRRGGHDRGRTSLGEPERAFLRWIQDAGDRRWGELTLERDDGDVSRYDVRHHADRGVDSGRLDRYRSPYDGREIARFDDGGRFRPLPGARTLPRGWLAGPFDGPGLVCFVDAIYPAGVANWYRDRRGELETAPYDETIARQTGRYRDLGAVGDVTLRSAAEAVCGDCVRRRAWDASSGVPEDVPRDDAVIPCPEACPFFLDTVRACHQSLVAGETHESSTAFPCGASGDDCAIGDVSDPGNHYRVRFRRALHERLDDPAGAVEAGDRR